MIIQISLKWACMKWYFKSIAIGLLIGSSIHLGCSPKKGDSSIYYQSDIEQWKSYFSTINADINLQHSVVLFTNPVYCGECHQELTYWNSSLNSIPDSTIHVVVIDRYAANADNFILREDFEFTYHYDTAANVLKDSLLATLPRRVYFRNNSIESVNRLGDLTSYKKLKAELIDFE